MNFKSRTEAYSYAILLLTQLSKRHVTSASDVTNTTFSLFNACIGHLKIAMENHEQDLNFIAELIEELITQDDIFLDEDVLLRKLSSDILNNAYQQTIKEKFDNPLARRWESELAIILFRKPTKAMMEAIQAVSEQILRVIEQLSLLQDKFDWSFYIDLFSRNYHVISFGAEENPTLEDIKKILVDNKPEQLAEIMHIHYKFAQGIIRKFPITGIERKPVGKMAEIVAKIWRGPMETFFSEGLKDPVLGTFCRGYIPDVLMYSSPLYKVLDNRGKMPNAFDEEGTQQLGLLGRGQEEYEIGLPTHHSIWTADCKAQGANLKSQYVLDLIENDAVYVSGPSGMTSVLLGQMEILANFPTEILKKNYLTAIMVYIVAAGFHSIHEVIAPAHYALDLVPGYEVHVPQQGKLAPPPNYHQFFAQQERIDPDFAARHDAAWESYLHYFSQHYVPHYLDKPLERKNSLPKSSLSHLGNALIDPALLNKVRLEMNRYINARGSNNGGLNFISRAFRNNHLTKEKLSLAIEFNHQVELVKAPDELEILVANTVNKNLDLEKKMGKTYGVLTQSGLNRSLEHIKTIIKDHASPHEVKYGLT
ncbi:hypothetical protein J2N86_04705 [Legionella lytica]|uniref:Uncharacterized protein n=1 Tax=Legionella lytica TaxID=96232 RepID=A0ABY4YB01_9GAMM|nr:hypothetical protein [Legionella lytica]USQ14616.1 hypothetical protein J2N86_04705 [Legionella lytica]